MKAKIIAGIGIVVLVAALAFSMKPKPFDEQFESKMNDMDSYILSGDMEITKGEGDFAGKFVQILTYMEEVFAKRQAFCLLVRIGTGSYEVSESMRRECEKRQQALGCHLADRIVESLMCQGVSEGTIGETNPYLQKLAFVAQMTAFAGYLVDLEKGEKMAVSREEAKRFVYEALVKSLN